MEVVQLVDGRFVFGHPRQQTRGLREFGPECEPDLGGRRDPMPQTGQGRSGEALCDGFGGDEVDPRHPSSSPQGPP